VPVLFVECVVSREEAIRRLNARSAEAREISDATPEVYEMQRGEFEPIEEIPSHVVIDTSRKHEPVLSDLDAALERARQ